MKNIEELQEVCRKSVEERVTKGNQSRDSRGGRKVNSDQRLADYDNPLVRKAAERLTGNTNTVLEKLDRLFHYVRDDIKVGFTQDGDLVKASTTTRLGKGQCNTKGTLLLALCKAVDLPASTFR